MIRAGVALLLLMAGGAAAGSEVELRHAEDVLSGGLSNWRETSLRAEWSPDRTAGVSVTASALERFTLSDWGLRASAHAPLADGLDVGLEASGSTTHQVIPMWSAGARASYVLGRGLVIGTGMRWSHYESGPVSTGVAVGNVGLEYYRGAFRVAWTTYVSGVDSVWSTSHALAGDLFYRGRDRIGVVLSAGRELESLGGGRVLATDILGAALVGRTAFGAGWSLTYGVEVQRQGDLYSRSGGRLGVLREF